MARRTLALLPLLLAPCGLASQLSEAEARLRGSIVPDAKGGQRTLTRARRRADKQVPGIPNIAGDVAAAEDVVANINTSWSDIQGLFTQANQTAAGVVVSESANIDDAEAALAEVQSAADPLSGLPPLPGNAGNIVEDMVIAFVSHVNASAEAARGQVLDAGGKAFAAISAALDEIRDVVDAVLLEFREALGKVGDLAEPLDDAAASADASSEEFAASAQALPPAEETGTQGGPEVEQRIWPFSSGGGKQSVWDAATAAIDTANKTLGLLAEKVDGINATLMGEVFSPLVSVATGALAEFANDCSNAVLVLPDSMSSQASLACDAGTAANGLIADAPDKMESSTADVVEKAKGLIGLVFPMVSQLYELVGKARDAYDVLEGRAAAEASTTTQ